jgi:hypothetical protein
MRSCAVRMARAALTAWIAASSSACVPSSVAESLTARTPLKKGPVALFSYPATDGSRVDGARMRGRFTVLLFITTFDSASQLMARQLNQILHTHVPRINAAAIVLEDSNYATFAQVFHDSLDLDYPVALADAATLRGESSFGPIRRVPTLVVLSPRAERVWAREGFVSPAFIEEALDSMAGPRPGSRTARRAPGPDAW